MFAFLSLNTRFLLSSSKHTCHHMDQSLVNTSHDAGSISKMFRLTFKQFLYCFFDQPRGPDSCGLNPACNSDCADCWMAKWTWSWTLTRWWSQWPNKFYPKDLRFTQILIVDLFQSLFVTAASWCWTWFLSCNAMFFFVFVGPVYIHISRFLSKQGKQRAVFLFEYWLLTVYWDTLYYLSWHACTMIYLSTGDDVCASDSLAKYHRIGLPPILGANYKKILRLSYDVIITYDNRKSNLR